MAEPDCGTHRVASGGIGCDIPTNVEQKSRGRKNDLPTDNTFMCHTTADATPQLQ